MPNFLQCTWEYIREGLFSKSTDISINAENCPGVYTTLAAWQPFFKDMVVILVTLGTFAAVTAVYLKYRPAVILEQTLGYNQCPDQWVFRGEDSMCHPLYRTTCAPFNPELQRGNQCDIAKRCMTTWKGLCD